MRISVNLATRPFVELRPFFVRLRLLMALLAVVAVGAMVASHILQTKLDRAAVQIDQLRAQMTVAQQEKLHNEQRMRLPANAAVLDRAHFLNTLFLSKSFSWTAVMMDLENVLPTGVQVTSIEPQISADGQVVIRLRVSGDRDRAVQLVRNLERSHRFLAPRLMGESVEANAANGSNGSANGAASVTAAPNAPPAGVEFEILADYNPLPAGQPFTRPARAERGASAPAAQGRRYGVVLKPYATAPGAAGDRSGGAR